MPGSHDDRVRAEFAHQAATFTAGGFAARGLDWIVDVLRPERDDEVLDVAAGAAHLGRALAPRVRHVTALDLTPEMLAQGERLAAEDGLTGIDFVVGDATALPWPAARFDLVVCHLTLHQVADPAAVVAEMVRVARPGARIGVVDMVADADPAVAAEADRLERLRDPSHGRTLRVDEIESLLAAAGASDLTHEVRDQPLDLEDWMDRSATAPDVRASIRTRVAADLDGGAPTGLRPTRATDGRVTFVHAWAIVTAVAPVSAPG